MRVVEKKQLIVSFLQILVDFGTKRRYYIIIVI